MEKRKRASLAFAGMALIAAAAVALGVGFWYLEGYRKDEAVYGRLAEEATAGSEADPLELFVDAGSEADPLELFVDAESEAEPESGASQDASAAKGSRAGGAKAGLSQSGGNGAESETSPLAGASSRPWDARLAGLDWASLKASIPNIVGWIRMASGADYPVVQGADDVRYLSVDAYGNPSGNGSIFMYSRNSPLWTDPVTFVYGHRMTTGTMFGTNYKYLDPNYVAQYPYFFIYTPEGRWRYRVFAVSSTTKDSPIYAGGAYGEEGMTAYLERVRAESQVFVPGVADWGSHIVALSTCTGPSGGVQRLLVLGALDGFLGADGAEMNKADAEKALAKKGGAADG